MRITNISKSIRGEKQCVTWNKVKVFYKSIEKWSKKTGLLNISIKTGILAFTMPYISLLNTELYFQSFCYAIIHIINKIVLMNVYYIYINVCVCAFVYVCVYARMHTCKCVLIELLKDSRRTSEQKVVLVKIIDPSLYSHPQQQGSFNDI